MNAGIEPGGSDTIVAVSTASGRSYRGLVRLSGPASAAVVGKLVEGVEGGVTRAANGVAAGRLRAPLPGLAVLVGWFARPNSYTGEDLAEVQLPGNPALLARLVGAAVEAGARPAEAGEFTFRAFVAGKMDLTQAEGVASTIAATSEGQLKAASMLRRGRLGRFAEELVERLGRLLALVEAGIDFVDQEDVAVIEPRELEEGLAEIAGSLDELLGHSRSWSSLEGLPRVVLAGAPNVGKSMLFNALLGRERAVVEAGRGTTRDVLSEPLRLTGAQGQAVEVMLVDMAGLDEPITGLDEQMQAAAAEALEQAELVVVLRSGDTDEAGGCGAEEAGRRLVVWTKADAALPRAEAQAEVVVSAKTGRGIASLRKAIARRWGGRAVGIGGRMPALQPRHEQGLREAKAAIEQARALVQPQRGQKQLEQMELVAGAMRAGLDELAGLGGRMTADEVIGQVFARFCVGK